MTVICHKRSTVHSIFQLGISQNTICAEMVDFRKEVCLELCLMLLSTHFGEYHVHTI